MAGASAPVRPSSVSALCLATYTVREQCLSSKLTTPPAPSNISTTTKPAQPASSQDRRARSKANAATASTCEGTVTTPLGYDGQYTTSDTGLVYLRSRQYDPVTAQFTSRDPLARITREPYTYAENNPLNVGDPTGLFSIGEIPVIGGGLEKVATRYVGFWDGFTQPVFGGTAALRSTLGLNGGLNQCSSEYQTANEIGGYTLDAEAFAPLTYKNATLTGLAVRGLGASEGEVVASNLFSQLASSLPDAEIARLRAAGFIVAGTAGIGYYGELPGLQALSRAESGAPTCGCS